MNALRLFSTPAQLRAVRDALGDIEAAATALVGIAGLVAEVGSSIADAARNLQRVIEK